MSEGDSIHRVASALRTALAGTPTRRFDAPGLIGPSPLPGRVVERVETRGRHLEIVWDDNLVLHTHMRTRGSWHLYRHGEPWRRPYRQMRAAIEVDRWVAVCFGAPMVETYRLADKRRHPGMGRLGPDVSAHGTDLASVVNLLLAYPDPGTRLADALLDQRVLRGLGNVYRCEVLWSTETSPFAPVGDLHEHDAIRLVNAASTLLRAYIGDEATETPAELLVYGRNGQPCQRCASTIECRRVGVFGRTLYWCPGCQLHLDPQLTASADETPMDPHPAAMRYLADLPWNRDVG